MTAASVVVVVVSWNARDLTLRCLDSLSGQTGGGQPIDVIVVDNASTDGSVEALRARRGIQVVELRTNTGFAAGANAGIRATSAPVVVLLNNDATADHDCVENLTAPLLRPTAAGDSPLGATTGRVRLRGGFTRAGSDSPAGSTLVSAHGERWIRVEGGTSLLNSTGNELTSSGNGRDRDWLAPASSPPAPREVFGFNGGCAALRRDALDDVGLFDEDLFMYYEDTELSWRLRRAGWDVAHISDAGTEHDHAASSGTSSDFFLDHNERNRLVVAIMHAPWAVVLRAGVRSLGRALAGPSRARRVRVLLEVGRRAPTALSRRRQIDRTSRVPRSDFSHLLVDDATRNHS
ncbi:MAG: glycosyltransferase family 2 protein [Cellulomonas sp.]